MKRQIIIAIMAIVLLLATNGTALDRIQVDNKQIMAKKDRWKQRQNCITE